MIFRQIMLYGLVGLSGFFINLGVLYFCNFIFQLGHNISSFYAFVSSVVTNYCLNRRWIFTYIKASRIHFNLGLIKYFFVNLVGLGLTLCILNLGNFFMEIV